MRDHKLDRMKLPDEEREWLEAELRVLELSAMEAMAEQRKKS